MNKIWIVMIGLLVLSAGLIAAYGPYHEKIAESESYDDLETLRDTEGIRGPGCVDSPEDFEEWKEMHAEGGCEGMRQNMREERKQGCNCPYR